MASLMASSLHCLLSQRSQTYRLLGKFGRSTQLQELSLCFKSVGRQFLMVPQTNLMVLPHPTLAGVYSREGDFASQWDVMIVKQPVRQLKFGSGPSADPPRASCNSQHKFSSLATVFLRRWVLVRVILYDYRKKQDRKGYLIKLLFKNRGFSLAEF